ncbi:MAG: hypothetical protein WCT52_05785 [Candidatus Micrarchaeia archaeon]|jgi:hypothetical protein
MNYAKLFIAALAFAIISQLVHTVGAVADMGYYTDPANAGLWSKVMMPAAAPPGIEFFAVSILFSLITGAIFADAYSLTKHLFAAKKSFRSDKYWNIGLKFGMFLFMLTSLTGAMSMFLLFALPFGLLVSWLAQGLVVCLASGVAFAKILN